MVIGPSNSARRSCSAVRVAPSPPPTMTIPPLLVTWVFYTMPAAICSSPSELFNAATTSRPRPLDDVRQHDDALAALNVGAGADALQRLLQMTHVAGQHMQHGVRGTRHGCGADHLGNVHPGGAQLVGGNCAVAEHLNVGLGVPADRVAVDHRREAP